MVNMEDEDNREPAMGNQAGLYRGVEEGDSSCNHYWTL